MMGLEEHLLGMFREDFEFKEGAAPSHLGSTRPSPTLQATAASAEPITIEAPSAPATATTSPASNPGGWTLDAEKELNKIPFFVRGKARRNTERFAREQGLATITVETLYDAKAHFSR
jgi:light-independent protochlorophyllide reductase subunit B